MATETEAAVARLAPPYAVAWRLREAGVDPDLIATALGVPVEAVPALLRLAEAKLDAELRLETTPEPE